MNAQGKSHYDSLGLPPWASADEIEATGLRLASELRDAMSRGEPGAAQRFREIEQAFEVLGDSSRKVQYDASLNESVLANPRIQPAPKSRRSLWLLVGATALASIFGGAAWYLLPSSTSSATTSPAAKAKTRPGKLASDAYAALKKLEAATETGITLADYRKAIAETWFQVKMFLESGEAKSPPGIEIAPTILGAMKNFNHAAAIWNAKVKKRSSGRFLRIGCTNDLYRDECEIGKELVAAIPDLERYSGEAQWGGEYVDLDGELQRQWKEASSYLRDLQLAHWQ